MRPPRAPCAATTGHNPSLASSSSLPHPVAQPPAGAPTKTMLASTSSAPLPLERGKARPQTALLARILYWAPLLAACVAALLIGFVSGIVFSAPTATGPELGRRLGPASPLSASLSAAPAPAPSSARHYNPAAWQALVSGTGHPNPNPTTKLVPGAAAAGAAADSESQALLAQDSFASLRTAAGAAADAMVVSEDGPAANAEQMFARALQNGHLAALGANGPSAAPGDYFATGATALAVPDAAKLDEVLRRIHAGAGGANGTSRAAAAQREKVAIKNDQGKLLPLAPKLKARLPSSHVHVHHSHSLSSHTTSLGTLA